MSNKFIIFSTMLLLQTTNATSLPKPLGPEYCLNIDKITHIPGSSWQTSADSSAWKILSDNKNSTLQFSADTPIQRIFQPYHNSLTRKLAIVTCHYANNTLVLQRTYEEDLPPYPDANYIAADLNKDIEGNFTSIFLIGQHPVLLLSVR